MDNNWWKPQAQQASVSDLLVAIFLQFALNTACLYAGLKLAGVKDAKFAKIVWSNLIGSLLVPKVVEFILNLAGLFNETFSMFLGFFVVVFIVQAMFDEEFVPAFSPRCWHMVFTSGFCGSPTSRENHRTMNLGIAAKSFF